jgi:hypothetical protein
MSDLSRRPSSGVSRRQREQRAYALVLATGGGVLLTAVLFVLAVVGIVSFGTPVLVLIVTALLGYLLKRTLSP